MKEMYSSELEKQTQELLSRIEIRRQERIKEASDFERKTQETEQVPAPVGPGGLDPSDVLNELPSKMQHAFVSRDVNELKQALGELSTADAAKYMKMCVDSGLWVSNAQDDDDGNEADIEA